jgi:ferredoxin
MNTNPQIERRRTMAYSINSECINCGACEPECPVEAISEKGDVRVIDADACTSCGACVEVCPVDAIDAG